MKRPRLLAGNWKMNKLNAELAPFVEAFLRELGADQPPTLKGKVDVLFALPYTLLKWLKS